MTVIPIYNTDGIKVNTLETNDNLSFVSGRVSKGNNCYYKGVGSPYGGCSMLTTNGHKIISESSVFYYGYNVINEKLQGKFGIFQEKFQPYFSDFIGSCGPKELKLIDNSKQCQRSSVEVLDYVEYDKPNKQYYFKVNYSCGRYKYLEGGNPKQLADLLDYLAVSGWNFPWDKTSINDVTYDGRVSDVADMFESKQLKHRLGTIYSVLYSLGKLNQVKYHEFLVANNYKHRNDMDYIFIALLILDKNGVNIDGFLPKQSDSEYKIYRHILEQHLIQGRNCAYVEDSKHGDKVKKMFIERVK